MESKIRFAKIEFYIMHFQYGHKFVVADAPQMYQE